MDRVKAADKEEIGRVSKKIKAAAQEKTSNLAREGRTASPVDPQEVKTTARRVKAREKERAPVGTRPQTAANKAKPRVSLVNSRTSPRVANPEVGRVESHPTATTTALRSNGSRITSPNRKANLVSHRMEQTDKVTSNPRNKIQRIPR